MKVAYLISSIAVLSSISIATPSKKQLTVLLVGASNIVSPDAFGTQLGVLESGAATSHPELTNSPMVNELVANRNPKWNLKSALKVFASGGVIAVALALSLYLIIITTIAATSKSHFNYLSDNAKDNNGTM